MTSPSPAQPSAGSTCPAWAEARPCWPAYTGKLEHFSRRKGRRAPVTGYLLARSERRSPTCKVAARPPLARRPCRTRRWLCSRHEPLRCGCRSPGPVWSQVGGDTPQSRGVAFDERVRQDGLDRQAGASRFPLRDLRRHEVREVERLRVSFTSTPRAKARASSISLLIASRSALKRAWARARRLRRKGRAPLAASSMTDSDPRAGACGTDAGERGGSDVEITTPSGFSYQYSIGSDYLNTLIVQNNSSADYSSLAIELFT